MEALCIREPLAEEAAKPTANCCLKFRPGMSARQQQILLIALRLFGEREYAAVSLRDIARAAGVSLTLIDHHFGPKHALFAAMVRSWHPVFEQAALDIRHALAQARLASPSTLLGLILRPVEQLLTDRDGLAVLRLWARHRHGTETATSGPVGLAINPYRQAIDRALERLYPACPASERAWAVGFAFAAMLEFAAGEPPPNEPGEAPALRTAARALLLRHIEGSWRAGLGAS